MKIIQKTISLFLTGLFLLLVTSPVVRAQGNQPADTTRIPDGAAILLENLLKEEEQSTTVVNNFSKKVEAFTTADTNVSFEYIDVKNRASLIQLAASMTDNRDYPVVVFKKAVFLPGMEILRTLDLQIKNYEHKDEQWQTLDEIHKAKYAQLENIVGLQGQRVEAYKSANVQLNDQIKQLNDQLTASVDLTEKSLKGRTRRNLWIGTLGGVFGFSLGVLISAL